MERFQRDAPTDDQLIAAGSFLGKICHGIVDELQSVFVLPLAFLTGALAVRIGIKVAFWPDLLSISYILFLATAYLVAIGGHPYVAMCVSAYILVLNLSEVMSRFRIENGMLRMLGYRKSQIGISGLVFAALTMAAAWGCIHVSISRLDAAAYSQPLSVVDGIYFSVTTFATVGYGDIYPRIPLTKLLCVAEILTGCLTLIFGVNLGMTVWVQRFSEAKGIKPPEVVAAPKDESAESAAGND